MLSMIWKLCRESVEAYLEDGAVSRGAAIAYYTVTSVGPVLLIVIAIAGLVFGRDAATGAIQAQASGLMGDQSAQLLQSVVKSAASPKSGLIATLIGLFTFLLTASGIFGEIQSALNFIWRAQPKGSTVSRLVRARLVSLGLVAALGFLLIVSLAVSAAVAALFSRINQYLPFGALVLEAINFLVSLALIAAMVGAIYKILPDRMLEWRDVTVGAVVTALLFTIGKSVIGVYVGSSSMATSYGAAGGLLIMLIWIYYSAQIFLLGAEFTKVYAARFGSLRGTGVTRSAERQPA